ncbi:MAG: ArnT family glycosyltransferase [Nitrospinales bacterium]
MDSLKTLKIDRRLFFLAFLLVAVFLHARTFSQPIIDWDEAVYLYLSEHMDWGWGHYSTQGSFIDNALSSRVYSAEVFYHPPVIPYLIKVLSVALPQFLAAKLLNLVFSLASFYFVFKIANALSDIRGAAIAVSLWALCPVFNLESNLVHLDFPMTFFILAGVWYFIDYRENRFDLKKLVLSGMAFVLAMLTKYTGPIYVLIPVLLVACQNEIHGKWKHVGLYAGILALGFGWWVFVFLKYGSLMPAEFVGHVEGRARFTSPYIESVGLRSWYHVWLYFLAICPLFALYLHGAGRAVLKTKKTVRAFYGLPPALGMLIALNTASVLAVLTFNGVNIVGGTNDWALRHNLPFLPVVYVTLGYIMTNLFKEENPRRNAGVIVWGFFTLVVMSFSTYNSLMAEGNLRALPALLLWVPGLADLFH